MAYDLIPGLLTQKVFLFKFSLYFPPLCFIEFSPYVLFILLRNNKDKAKTTEVFYLFRKIISTSMCCILWYFLN